MRPYMRILSFFKGAKKNLYSRSDYQKKGSYHYIRLQPSMAMLLIPYCPAGGACWYALAGAAGAAAATPANGKAST